MRMIKMINKKNKIRATNKFKTNFLMKIKVIKQEIIKMKMARN